MSKKITKIPFILFYALFYLLLLNSNTAFASEKIILKLKWLHQFQSAGYYAALDQGYFADEGLDVKLDEGSDVDLKRRKIALGNIDQVLKGEAHYGVTDSIVLLHHVQNSGIVLVAPIFQHSPNVLVSLRSSNINKPKDLIGRRLGFYDNNTDGISLLAMLADQGVLEAGLIRDNLNNRIDRLINGEIDAIAAYSTNELFLLKEMGYAVNVIDPKNYGMDFYGDIFFTSAEEAKNNPQRVIAMRRAILRGWNYALDNKEELVELILKKYNTQNKTYQALMTEAQGLEPLIARHTVELGTLTQGRLEYMLNLLAKNNIIELNSDQVNLEQGLSRLVFDNKNSSLNLTAEEWSFLSANPILKVGIDRNWPPFEYFNTNKDELQGISQDYLKILGDLLNLKFVIKDKLTWSEVLNESKSGHIDLLPAITKTTERSDYLIFTQPYIRSPMVIVTNNKINFISNINELNDKRVAVVKGYSSHEVLSKNHPLIKLELKNTALESLKAVAAGEIDAFVDNLVVANYLIRTQGLANLKISGQTPYSFDLSIGVQKDQELLKSILDKSLLYISRQQHNKIYDKWVTLEVTNSLSWGRVLPPFLILTLISIVLSYYAVYFFRLNKNIEKVNSKLKLTELDLKEKNNQLEKLSITDKLTEVYNRHYLDRVLNEQIALTQRHQRTVTIALFDLDFFKQVNDRFGHLMGDKVLLVFATLAKKNIRTTDIFGRWGGEEFLLICPETNKHQAYVVVEKIRKGLEAYIFEEGLTQTVSIGLVEYQAQLSLEALLLLADQKLYLAKSDGRNRIID